MSWTPGDRRYLAAQIDESRGTTYFQPIGEALSNYALTLVTR